MKAAISWWADSAIFAVSVMIAMYGAKSYVLDPLFGPYRDGAVEWILVFLACGLVYATIGKVLTSSASRSPRHPTVPPSRSPQQEDVKMTPIPRHVCDAAEEAKERLLLKGEGASKLCKVLARMGFKLDVSRSILRQALNAGVTPYQLVASMFLDEEAAPDARTGIALLALTEEPDPLGAYAKIVYYLIVTTPSYADKIKLPTPED